MKKIIGIVFLFFLFSSSADEANAQCVRDVLGNTYCAPPGGGLSINSLGRPMCGIGGRVRDSLGRVICSSVQMGYATIDFYGRAKCTGRCVRGNPRLCQKM